MALSARINQLLAPMGLKLQRMPDTFPLNQAPSRNAGHQVELIGASGVGKSYIYGQLNSQLTGDWLSRRQINKYCIHRRNLFKVVEGRDTALLEYLLCKKHEFIWSQDIPLWRKQRLYKYCGDLLSKDAFIRDLCFKTQGLFIDEGVQHNFSSELLAWHTQYSSQNAKDMQRLKDFMKGRSVILVDASVEHIMSNLKKRHTQLQGKAMNDWVAWMTEEDIFSKISKAKESKRRWLNVAKTLGTATLELDASGKMSVNERKLADFLKSILQEKE